MPNKETDGQTEEHQLNCGIDVELHFREEIIEASINQNWSEKKKSKRVLQQNSYFLISRQEIDQTCKKCQQNVWNIWGIFFWKK